MNFEEFSNREKQILQRIIHILRQELHPAKIILFGSRAKGNFQKNADFDIAVEALEPDRKTKRKLLEKLEGISGLYKIDIVFLGNIDPGFKEIILNYGKVLYAKRNRLFA